MRRTNGVLALVLLAVGCSATDESEPAEPWTPPSGEQTAGGSETSGSDGMDSGADGSGGDPGDASGLAEVGCWRTGEYELCFGRIGNLWVPVYPACLGPAYDAQGVRVAEGPAAVAGCGSDHALGWDEVACWEFGEDLIWCFGRKGGWWIQLFAECQVTPGAESESRAVSADPGLHQCGASEPAGSGWDDVRCWDVGLSAPICYGKHGAYWIGPSAQFLLLNGVMANCVIAEYDADPELHRFDPATARCH
jgi:hypothetical protein